MFARVSTYQAGAETAVDAAVTEKTVSRVLQLPGCRGVYFLNSAETGKALSITLWESEEALTASRQAANTIRAESSSEQGTQIVGVEEFEVLASSLKA